MATETVAVTGGSGLIGSETVSLLDERGYHPVNLDQRPPEGEAPGDFVEVDLVDAGETYGALARWEADAVIHLGTITGPRRDPGYVTFESNAMSPYIVLEAAAGLGIEAVSLASSINAMGWSFHPDCPEIEYLPIDETHPTTPRDPYALGKRVTEIIAAGVGRDRGTPERIATLRYPGVYDDQRLADLADREQTLADLEAEYSPGDNPGFSYIHVRDAASIAVRGIEADYTGHETFWAVAPDSSVGVPTERLLEAFYPDTEVRGDLSGTDGLFDVSKAHDVLGWEAEHSWRDYS